MLENGMADECWNCATKDKENGSLRKFDILGRDYFLCGICSSAYIGNPMFRSKILSAIEKEAKA